MLTIRSVLVPFRLDLSKREPISLRLEIRNDSKEEKLVSLKFVLAKGLSTEKTTIASSLDKRLGLIKPNQTKLIYLDIFPKVSTREVDYPARLIIYEHYNKDYEYVDREYKKEFVVRVIRS